MTAEFDNFVQANQSSFTRVLEGSKFVVADFAAEWCSPCVAAKSALEEAAHVYPEVLFCRVDIDESPELANAYQIEAVPTIIFIEEGMVQRRSCGFLNFEKLANDIERLLGRSGKDLTHIFADGDIWDLGEEDAAEILSDVSKAVLLFSGTDYHDFMSFYRKLDSLASEFSERIFFGVLDSEECTSIRGNLKIPRKQAVVVLMKQGVINKRLMGHYSRMELRNHIYELLQAKPSGGQE